MPTGKRDRSIRANDIDRPFHITDPIGFFRDRIPLCFRTLVMDDIQGRTMGKRILTDKGYGAWNRDGFQLFTIAKCNRFDFRHSMRNVDSREGFTFIKGHTVNDLYSRRQFCRGQIDTFVDRTSPNFYFY